jgi:tetratricopeptide (TPR) repeat protein
MRRMNSHEHLLTGRTWHRNLNGGRSYIAAALLEIGQFADALPWFERAVAEAEQADEHGRVDRAILKDVLSSLAACLEELGDLDLAQTYRRRADEL